MFGNLDCQVWSAWDGRTQCGPSSRFHAEILQRLQTDMVPVLLFVNHTIDVVDAFVAGGQDGLVVVKSGVSPALEAGSPLAVPDEDDATTYSQVYVYSNSPLSKVAATLVDSCTAMYLGDSTSDTPSKPGEELLRPQLLSRMLHIWRLLDADAQQLWTLLSKAPSDTVTVGDAVERLTHAHVLAAMRKQCWELLNSYSCAVGRINKMSPKSVVEPKLWCWEEVMLLLWLGVPPSRVFPDKVPTLVRCCVILTSRKSCCYCGCHYDVLWQGVEDPLGHIVAVLMSSVVGTVHPGLEAVSEFLTAVGSLTTTTVSIPKWLSALLTKLARTTDVMPEYTRNALQAVAEFLTVLPLEALQWAVDTACACLPERCRDTVAFALEPSGGPSETCGTVGLCPSCTAVSCLTALSNWRHGLYACIKFCYYFCHSSHGQCISPSVVLQVGCSSRVFSHSSSLLFPVGGCGNVTDQSWAQ